MAFFLKGYVSFSEYSTSSTAAPAPMPLAPQHQKTKRLLGAARGSTTQPFWTAQQTADSFQIFKNERNFGHFGASFQRQYVGNNVFFFSSFAFFLYLSKRAFQLDNFSIETSLLQLPENQTTHTHRDLFRENSEFPRSTHKTEISSTSSALPSRGHETEVGAAKRMEGWSGAGLYRETRYQDPKPRRLGGARSSLCPFKIP